MKKDLDIWIIFGITITIIIIMYIEIFT